MSNKLNYDNIKTKKISWKGYSLLKSELTKKQLDKIKKDLTVIPKVVPGYGTDTPDSFIIYSENKDKIYIPKHYGFKKLGKPNKDALFKGEKINCKFKGDLREYQLNIMNHYHEHRDKYQGGIISVGAGRGKTVMAIYEIAKIGLKTLILVHTSVLYNQWKERLNEYLPDAKIGFIQGKNICIMGKDVVIAMIQSLSNPKKDIEYPKEIFKDFGFLIVDECHHMGAKMFCRCLKKTMFKYCLGLSATPKRNDGLSKVFKYFLGDICFKDNSIQKTDEEKLLDHIPDANVRVYRFLYDDDKYNNIILNYQNKPNTITMETNISKFMPRTEFIISLLSSLISEGRKILILTSRREHIVDLLMKIEENKIASCGAYVGGMKEKELDESKKKDILVATYAMAEEGFDCQSLDTLIMSTPKKNLEQCVGRILRKRKNTRINIPLIIDILDDFSSFSNWYNIRLKHYKLKNYMITNYDINGKDFKILKEIKHKWKPIENESELYPELYPELDPELDPNLDTKSKIKIDKKKYEDIDNNFSIDDQKHLKKLVKQYGCIKKAIEFFEFEKNCTYELD
jgi:superfamily II DNA or RNA helicase